MDTHPTKHFLRDLYNVQDTNGENATFSDPYTPEEPEPEEVDGQGDEEAAADDVNKQGGQTEEDAEQQICSNEAECSSEETDGTADKESEESEESESEGTLELGDEEAETDEQQEEVDETAQAEEEYMIEDEWMDYFDRLEEMELSKDKEKKKKAGVKVEKVVEKPKPKDKPAAMPKVAKAKKQPDKEVKKEQSKKAKVVSKEPKKEEAAITNAELEETLNEINKLVDIITNGNNGHDTKQKEQAQYIKEESIKPKVDETVKVPKRKEESQEETESKEIPTEEILQTAEEILLENEALRKENGELRQELKEEFEEEEEEEDDDDDDDDEDVTPQKPDVKKQAVYNDAENYPTYNVDLDVLVDSFEEQTKDEWDQYFDDLEQKKSSGPQPDQQVPKESKLKKKKHAPESQVYKEENYPHYDVDLDVLVDSFEGGAQDEWTRYFDALEAEEDKRLNEKVKKKKGRRSGGGSSFFAEGMPMKDNKTRIRQFLEREKLRREQMKHKIDRDSIKSYLMGKSNEKKKDNPKETIENVNDKKDTKVDELLVEEKTIEQDPQVQNEEKVEDSSILRETLLKLVKDVEKLLYQNGHTNGEVPDEAATADKVPREEIKTEEVKESKSKKLKGEMNTEKSSKLKGDTLEIFPSNIDLTDPESIVNTIKHTTTVANKMMQEFADSLTAQLLDVKAARARNGEDDDDEGDEPWEVIEERDEKLKELCKKGRLSSADCNQVIHGRSMEHVHNFHKVKSPKVPRFKPSPPSPEPEPEQLQEPTEEKPEATDTEAHKEPVAHETETPDIQAEPTFDDNIMSETGTNFDESLFYDQETIERIEEEKFYYKFEDWESPASSSPIVKGALDYRSQKYFDELEGIDTTTTTTPLPQDGQIKEKSENVKDNKAEIEQKKRQESKEDNSNISAKEKVSKEEEKKKEKKLGKICDCEKARKQLKSKKDKHYDEEEWENGKFKGKKENSDSTPCDCKWKLLP